jgi:glutaminase
MNYKKLFSEIPAKLKHLDDKGKVASYIPELGNVDPTKFGIHLTTVDNKNFSLGDSDEKFSIQSIAKVLSLTLAFKLDEDKLWNRVGVEPSGTSFNSLVQLEYEKASPATLSSMPEPW